MIRTVVLGGALLLPVLGLAWARPERWHALWSFPPPVDIPRGYVRWSWWWCAALLIPWFALALAWWRARRHAEKPEVATLALEPLPHFPSWGWWAIGWVVAWWVIAWTRFSAFSVVQRYTFFPLWVGFVVAVSAATARRRGRCLLQRRPGALVALAGLSAAFWWGFEWLNRFARNWHYLGVEDLGALAYALHATVCFSTVLPAVTVVQEHLRTYPLLQRQLAVGPPLRALLAPWVRAGLFGLAGVMLVLTGALPDLFYPSLWLAPLLLSIRLAGDKRGRGWVAELARGEWGSAGSWALAALGCGFFWELWNVHSLAKWIYTIPHADVGRVFEMPILGYLGYLPFGLECAIVSRLVLCRGTHVPPPRPSAVSPRHHPRGSGDKADESDHR